MSSTKEDKKSLYEQVYFSIKEKIIKGDYSPGQKLTESKLANLLGVSRTPVREALRRLEMDGLVVSRPSHGVEVTNFSKEAMDSLFDCNSVLEGLAARKAAELIDNESLILLEECLFLAEKYFEEGELEKVAEKNTLFHDTIVSASNNPTLTHMMLQIRSQVLAYRTFISSYKFRPTFMKEHYGIFEAIKNREADLAEDRMRKHIINDCRAIASQIEGNK
ncbi:GntR family transcriptional regulator [Bacillus sp. B15-48]|uniref:GntR family transcriptional regulator n=1 Tax=Bacillus sp. B15-48 TaxID=1548601 RepID=UPI00193FDC05|nr:GntR family transcriptional regulator [Bacillus sp. B15-48]MBM4761417.1 FCD domain-containing protein [Bacillus sp. B15-48]